MHMHSYIISKTDSTEIATAAAEGRLCVGGRPAETEMSLAAHPACKHCTNKNQAKMNERGHNRHNNFRCC